MHEIVQFLHHRFLGEESTDKIMNDNKIIYNRIFTSLMEGILRRELKKVLSEYMGPDYCKVRR